MCSTLEARLARLRAAIDEVALAARADAAEANGLLVAADGDLPEL